MKLLLDINLTISALKVSQLMEAVGDDAVIHSIKPSKSNSGRAPRFSSRAAAAEQPLALNGAQVVALLIGRGCASLADLAPSFMKHGYSRKSLHPSLGRARDAGLVTRDALKLTEKGRKAMKDWLPLENVPT